MEIKGDIMSITGFIVLLGAILLLRHCVISAYKVGYYEQKLSNLGVDVEHIENISLVEIIEK